MSYLGFPRIVFAGTFQADVVTVNNALPYYDNNLFEPRYQWRMNLPDINGLWNPGGTGALRLSDVRVTAAYAPDGTAATSTWADPVVGGRVADDNLRANGKFADLDPQNQMVSELYGLRIRLVDAAGREAVRGDFVPAAMDDLWMRAILPSGRSDAAASYQSVLTGVAWADTLDSRVLRALRDTTQDGRLSIKFNMDGVEDGIEHWPNNITFGRIVGSIGPYARGEPLHLVAARRLRTAANSSYNHAPCRVDVPSATVFVDLGNSVRATSRGGPLVDTGPLRLAVVDTAGKPTALAPLDGLGAGFYEHRAGIVTARLTPEQLNTVAASPIAVVDAADPPAVVLCENSDATIVRADGFVFRLYPRPPEDTAATTLHVTRYGQPLADARVFVRAPQGQPAVAFPAKLVTDARGRAGLVITGSDPGNPRGALDGVAVRAPYGLAARPDAVEGFLNVRVFDRYDGPDNPTWVRDVQPIFQRYANLFPAMRHVLDLGNYNHVVRHAGYIRRTLLAPRESPNHMPVTRDLSPGKRDMIVRWLDKGAQPPILDIRTPDDLRSALQQAVQVEQATVPPYLTALLSIRDGANIEIAQLIRGVVLEEMQHMAQVCNILNAVGGGPRIGRPGLVPTYPGPLPGPVLPDLRVRLRRLSLDHVRAVFMAIEQPEHPTVDGRAFSGRVIDPRSVSVDRHGAIASADEQAMRTMEGWFAKAEYTPQTIGWFYNQLARAILRLDRDGNLFTGAPERQVSWPDAPGVLYRVTDRRSALLAILQIIEQGEGSPHDLNDNDVADPNELGHYYRFAEIVRGRQLVRDPAGKWVYEGKPIPFDPDGVHPMIDDPDTYRLPAGSVGRRESQRCDESYTNLMTSLQRVFDGHADEVDDAVGLMAQVQVQARKLFDIPSADGAPTVLGPAFQSPGVTF